MIHDQDPSRYGLRISLQSENAGSSASGKWDRGEMSFRTQESRNTGYSGGFGEKSFLHKKYIDYNIKEPGGYPGNTD